MLYREIIAVCSQIHTKHINTVCGLNVELVNIKPGGTYIWTLKGYTKGKEYSGIFAFPKLLLFLLCSRISKTMALRFVFRLFSLNDIYLTTSCRLQRFSSCPFLRPAGTDISCQWQNEWYVDLGNSSVRIVTVLQAGLFPKAVNFFLAIVCIMLCCSRYLLHHIVVFSVPVVSCSCVTGTYFSSVPVLTFPVGRINDRMWTCSIP